MNNIATKNRFANIEDDQYRLIINYYINPKSLNIAGLYGYVNHLTNEWNDGIIGRIFKDNSEKNNKEF